MRLAAEPGVIANAPVVGWLFEVAGPMLWVAMFIVFTQQCLAQGRLTRNMLVFIASTTMWWQEWFGDWAAYIVYNPHFQLIPWGSTLWTTPNKPWAVIPAYGWYYTLSFLALFWLCGRYRQWRPGTRPWVAAIVVGVPLWYAVDLLIEGGASFLGWWSYDSFVGPALQSPAGNFPLIYPIVFFAAWCTLMGALVYDTDDAGVTALERLLRMDRLKARFVPDSAPDLGGARTGAVAVKPETVHRSASVQWQAVRLAVWVIAFNASYWLVFIFPIIIIRELLGSASAIVP